MNLIRFLTFMKWSNLSKRLWTIFVLTSNILSNCFFLCIKFVPEKTFSLKRIYKSNNFKIMLFLKYKWKSTWMFPKNRNFQNNDVWMTWKNVIIYPLSYLIATIDSCEQKMLIFFFMERIRDFIHLYCLIFSLRNIE